MSVHNVLLHYLSETGLFGAGALLYLTLSGVVNAYRRFRMRLSLRQSQTAGAVLAMMVVFACSITFMRAWTWSQEGFIMAILFGLTAASLAEPAEEPATDTTA
jgi:O-antigen ligase